MSDDDVNIDDVKEIPECGHSPNGYHLPQSKDLNTIPACQYCGKVL